MRAPQQDRARRTFERVLEAGAALLAEGGYEGFSISEVCRRAQVSPGALYERVDNKDALFLAIHERELERITAIALAAFADPERWAALPTPELITGVVHELARQYLDDGPLLKAFILRAAVEPEVRAAGARHLRQLAEALVRLLMTRAHDYPHPAPALAVGVACRTMLDSLSWRTAFGLDFATTAALAPDTWIRELAAVCRTYLLTPAG